MILVFMVYKNQWTVDFANVILAGLGKAVTLFAWVEVRVRKAAFATVILSKGGEVTFAKCLDVLASVKIVLVMVTVIAPVTSVRATPVGQVSVATFQIAPAHPTAMIAGIVMLL